MAALTKVQRRMLDKRVVAIGKQIDVMRFAVDKLGDPKCEYDAHLTACFLHEAIRDATKLAREISNITIHTL
jgi:hypothetical protein